MAASQATPAITKHILKLARQIDATASPEYVTVETGADCVPNRSFENVTAMVKKHGGSTQHGWTMREQTYFAEGEFCAVWRCLDGRLIDVTPRADGQTKILFLPDSTRVWEGEPVEPRRLMLRETPCYCGTGLPFRICHGMADD
jgi:hypothetical protein